MVFSYIELVSAFFILLIFFTQFLNYKNTKNSWVASILFLTTVTWLVVDAFTYFINGPQTSYTILYIINLIDYLLTPTIGVAFALYCNFYVKNKAKISSWYFLTPAIIQAFNYIVFTVAFVDGNVTSYKGGYFETASRYPILGIIIYGIFLAYFPIVTFLLRKRVGYKPFILTSVYVLLPMVGIIIIMNGGNDMSAVATGLSALLVVFVLQSDIYKDQAKSMTLAENNDRILALEDNFNSLYEVDLKTGNYTFYVKKGVSANNDSKSIANRNFFEDAKVYFEKNAYQDDLEGVLNLLNPQYITEQLNKNNMINYYVRSYVYGEVRWSSMRIVFKNDDKKSVVIGVFDADDEMKAKEKDSLFRKQLIEGMIDNDALFFVNLKEDSRRTLHNATVDADNYSDNEKYSESIKRYVEKNVSSHDRERVREMSSVDYIREKIKESNEFSFKYRDISLGMHRFFEMKIVKLSDEEVLVSFLEKDEAVLDEMIFNSIKGDYIALLAVDMDEAGVRVLKNQQNRFGLNPGDYIDFKELMLKISALYPDDQKTIEYFRQLSDIEYFRNKFLDKDKSSYTFVSSSEKKKWVTTTESVVSRHSENNEPAFVVISFNYLDEDASANASLQKRLERDMKLINGLAEEYYCLFYIDMDENQLNVYTLPKEIANASRDFLSSNVHGMGLIQLYGVSEFVHPEDRHLFKDINNDYVREKLAHRKKFSIRFRRKISTGYTWFEVDFIKAEKIDERANVIFAGYSECNEEIKKEHTLQSCFNIMNKNVTSYEAVQEALTTICDYYGGQRAYVCEIIKQKGMLENTYEFLPASSSIASLKHTEVSLEFVQKWLDRLSTNESIIVDAKDPIINSDSSVKFLDDRGISKLLLAPMINNGELVGYLGIDNPNHYLNDLVTARTVAAITLSEILKRKEGDEEHVTLEKLTNSFSCVFFVDLDRDYIHNWKVVPSHKDVFANVKIYSHAMKKYIDNFTVEEDRPRLFKEFDPRTILERFKDNDMLSITLQDVSLSEPQDLVFDMIKVNEEGSQFVQCIRNVTSVIAKEKEQHQILQDALERADAANKSKTTFLFNMSHDIRTPMNAILGFTDMAIKYVDDKDKTLDCLMKTQQAGNMLLSLINSVLEVSRIESGHASLDLQPADVTLSFASFESTMKELADAKYIDLSFEFLNIKNKYIMCDIARSMRIFVNVISNAIKYTENGGKVKVTCEQISDPVNKMAKYKFTIEDNGIGMSKDFQKHVFEQFSREKTSTVSGIQGTGLGMAVVKSFVDLMNGDITCESEQGLGTKFTIILPFEVQETELYTDPKTNMVVNAEKNIENTEKRVKLFGRKVLLVDDNALNREIAAEILSDEGLAVDLAFDGRMAVDKVVEKGSDYYDFVLMDIQMPIMDGYEATKEIRRLYPDAKLPIIALSANAFAEDKIASLEAGMNDHVAKPINVKQLMLVLADYIN